MQILLALLGRQGAGNAGLSQGDQFEMFDSIMRTRVLTAGVPAWATKWIFPRHFVLKWPENGQEYHRDDK